MRSRSHALLVALVVALAASAPPLAAAADPKPRPARLTWLGQAGFLLESAGGTRVVMDPPAASVGYALPKDLKADVVTVSHEHGDHNNVELVQGKPRVLRGLTADKKGWTKIDTKVKDVAIRSVGVYHDDKKGALRGLDTIFIFETGGLRIAHLGDLGHALDAKQLKEVGGVDIVLVPVGGFFTIDGAAASKVVDALRPRLAVVLMHYKTPACTVKELAGADGFLADKTKVRREPSNVLSLDGLKAGVTPEIIVLAPPPGA